MWNSVTMPCGDVCGCHDCSCPKDWNVNISAVCMCGDRFTIEHYALCLVTVKNETVHHGVDMMMISPIVC